jgi:uncharacterized protein YbbC (DUF1343 family)
MDAILHAKSVAEVEATWDKELKAFRERRERYLLYPATCPR